MPLQYERELGAGVRGSLVAACCNLGADAVVQISKSDTALQTECPACRLLPTAMHVS